MSGGLMSAHHCSSVRSCQVALFRWPTRKRQADAWRRFVETRRRSWKPSSASRLWSLHFIHSSFTNYNQFKLGKRNRLRMVPGAVPTVHSNGVGSSSASGRRRVAVDRIPVLSVNRVSDTNTPVGFHVYNFNSMFSPS